MESSCRIVEPLRATESYFLIENFTPGVVTADLVSSEQVNSFSSPVLIVNITVSGATLLVSCW